MNKFIFRLIILLFLSVPFHTVQAQTSVKRTYTATEVVDHEGNNLDEKCLELSILPATNNQAPLIMFTLTSSPDSKYGGTGVWFKKGKSFYVDTMRVISGKETDVLGLGTSESNLFVSIMLPEDRSMWGNLCFMNKKSGDAKVVYFKWSDTKEIFELVSDAVKRFNFLKGETPKATIN